MSNRARGQRRHYKHFDRRIDVLLESGLSERPQAAGRFLTRLGLEQAQRESEARADAARRGAEVGYA